LHEVNFAHFRIRENSEAEVLFLRLPCNYVANKFRQKAVAWRLNQRKITRSLKHKWLDCTYIKTKASSPDNTEDGSRIGTRVKPKVV